MLFYRCLITLLVPFLGLALLFRVIRRHENWRDFNERIGNWHLLPTGPVIWLHGASNGELTAARKIIVATAARHPDATLLITCNSTSAKKMLRDWGLERADIRLAPLDLRWIYRRILARTDLAQFILFEADFWPNRNLTLQEAGIPTAIVGARMSAKSANIWAKFPKLSARIFGGFDLICAQDTASQESLRSLGAKASQFGAQISLKSLYTSSKNANDHARRRNVWLAASTHDGEDAALLNAQLIVIQTVPDMQMILAPRHPKRAAKIAQIALGLGLSVQMRSVSAPFDGQSTVYIADTLGEMDQWYDMAGTCFVAGSLAKKGGHTPFEPAMHNCAILHGPHLENFAEPYAMLHNANGARLCETPREIAINILELRDLRTADEQRSNANYALSKITDIAPVLEALSRLSKH
jgi:3-deoxy-D-manno-octulosonic-acid transferase